VLDVKTGDGAFMVKEEDSRALAEAMLAIGRGMGKKVVALITDMEQPLGRTVGNALEIAECIETLQGKGPEDLETLSVELAAWMLSLAGASADPGRGRAPRARGARFRRWLEEVPGSDRLRVAIRASATTLGVLPRAAETVELRAESSGRVTVIAAGRWNGGHAARAARDGGQPDRPRRRARAAQEGGRRRLRRGLPGHGPTVSDGGGWRKRSRCSAARSASGRSAGPAAARARW
jgi:thymidine phosphorylase